ncbi:SBBP repeat-containing protein [Brumimicrobium sp.]|uniref:SBBP repeat-containing protein n=1 Tax=Brumimicrobium sp. TaxID=2029867 RepID=UPI003A93E14C
MKKLFTLLIFYVPSVILVAQTSSIDWVKRIGGNYDEFQGDIHVDNSGDIIYTGSFMGTVDFDPGLGTFELSSSGYTTPPYISPDVFVSKLDENGSFLWAKSLGGVANDGGSDVATDVNGNIYISGSFVGTSDFNPDSSTYNLTSNGDRDAFVLKLNSNGEFVWAKSFGGSQADGIKSLTIDGNGNIYTTGEFRGTVDFDPGSGTYNMTSAGNTDAFITKYDANGNFEWAQQLGNAGYDTGESIVVDSYENIYFTGGTWSSGNYQIFISKVDANGNFLWTKELGDTGVGLDIGYSIITDNDGNNYTIGQFQNTVDFDPGPGEHNLTAMNDIFVLKLNSNGEFVWVKQFGSSSNGYGSGYDITLDPNGNIYGTGRFAQTIDFNPGPDVYNLTSETNSYDAFMFKLTASGDFVWAKSFGGEEIITGTSIFCDNSGNLYTAGVFQNSGNFDQVNGGEILTSSGGYDLYILKLENPSASMTKNKQKLLSIYPNPSKGKLHINGNYKSAEIYDLNGKKLFSFDNQSTEINISQFNKGLYIMKVFSTDGISTFKIVKE